jgi:hypothetical protein
MRDGFGTGVSRLRNFPGLALAEELVSKAAWWFNALGYSRSFA